MSDDTKKYIKAQSYWLSKLRNEKTVWSRQKNRKQKLFIILYGYQQDNNKIPTNQVASFKDWICAATLPISAFRNGNQKLEEKWAGRHD